MYAEEICGSSSFGRLLLAIKLRTYVVIALLITLYYSSALLASLYMLGRHLHGTIDFVDKLVYSYEYVFIFHPINCFLGACGNTR